VLISIEEQVDFIWISLFFMIVDCFVKSKYFEKFFLSDEYRYKRIQIIDKSILYIFVCNIRVA
jgi:hypothetical protein